MVTVRPPVTGASVHLRRGTSDVATYVQILVDEEYGFPLEGPPRTIVDAGANVGLASVWFALRYPHAHIVAIEPDAGNVGVLQQNCSPFPQITVVQAALWGRPGQLVLHDPGLGPWAFQVREGHPSGPGEVVTGLTVGELLARRDLDLSQIDLLKLDIEGSEKEVLETAEPWIDSVRALAVEVHDRFKPGCTRALFTATGGDFPVERHQGNVVFLARRSPPADAGHVGAAR
jgi:FkbM family methyltransferase